MAKKLSLRKASSRHGLGPSTWPGASPPHSWTHPDPRSNITSFCSRLNCVPYKDMSQSSPLAPVTLYGNRYFADGIQLTGVRLDGGP